MTLIDIYQRPHTLLPFGFVLRLDQDDDWCYEPSEQALDITVREAKLSE